MKLVSRRGSSAEVMALAEEALQRGCLRRAQRPLLAGHGGEKRHRLAAPGDDDPLSGFSGLHIASQFLFDFPQAHPLLHQYPHVDRIVACGGRLGLPGERRGRRCGRLGRPPGPFGLRRGPFGARGESLMPRSEQSGPPVHALRAARALPMRSGYAAPLRAVDKTTSTWIPARASMPIKVSILKRSILPRTRLLIRGWVTPNSLAAAA